ncbi:hypothetical protein EVAR_9161_1 [Eumeta japonica]|uniref:Uncharacterized protein n=1 Tax=Eumeta variegata TaxID=151549 RepID=A0A4C1TW81_EUMVA|nr:hypothetical protein EVAR_9161_1 [Eumeta japonica]
MSPCVLVTPTEKVYISQATLLPFSLSTVSSGTGELDARSTCVGAKLRSLWTLGLSRHEATTQSMRAHTAALSRVAAASAICIHAITTRSRGDGNESSSNAPSL